MSSSSSSPSSAMPVSSGLDTLLERRPAFHGFLTKRLGDPTLADDLLQDAYARAMAKLPGVRDRNAILAWFYRLLRNVIVDHHRSAKGRSEALARLADELADEAVLEGPFIEEPNPCGCVARLFETIDPSYRAALERVTLEGAAVTTFAQEIGITPNNAGVRLFRAREALRRELVATCGACAQSGCADCSCEPPTNSSARGVMPERGPRQPPQTGDSPAFPEENHMSASSSSSPRATPPSVQESHLAITGMTCPACVRRVDKGLRAVPGVDDVRIDLASGRAVVAHAGGDVVPADLVAAVERAGYGATPAVGGAS